MKKDLFNTERDYPKLVPGPLVDQLPSTQQKVLALSWKQPYASLMLPPFNKIETRKWQTKYRGLVLICATLTSYKDGPLLDLAGPEQFNRIFAQTTDMRMEIFKTRGYAIGIGRLIDCRPMTNADEDKCFVKYNPTLYCHVYDEVMPIDPFRWHGSQGWSQLTFDQLKQVIIHLSTPSTLTQQPGTHHDHR